MLRLPSVVEAPVYGWERLVLLRHLLYEGLTKAAIAERLGVSRRVLYYWLESGRRVYYGTLADRITSLEEAQLAGRSSHQLRTLVFPSLLVVDELGYLPISRTGAMLFFQLMSRRYEHAATVLTSNKSFEEWG